MTVWGGRWPLLMPRRTQTRNPKSKQQLQFVQAPLDGAYHPYGPKVRCARNPKIFLSEEQHQSSTAHSWVTPQFDASMMSLALHPRRRRGTKKSCSDRSALDGGSLLSLTRHRKASVCKFPALSFEKHAAAPPRPPVARHGEKAKPGGARADERTSEPVGRGPSPNCNTETLRRLPSVWKGSAQDAAAFKLTPAAAVSHTGDRTINTPVGGNRPSFTDDGFTPPDIETPDALPQSRTCGATEATCLSRLRLLFPPTPLQAPPPPVLVSDTPEEHYGKNWRRSRLSFL
ncbi:RAD9, HUS1, RAD1-interacting nuclear orphan protein 1 [Anguilla rostrata]|uniref:RAD9, HUS1, RAD1-interacting nuclear orphan protein 1 n=1 Tax=Anguilla rostrata TaxID=7938 RepID=UPI0030CE1D9E